MIIAEEKRRDNIVEYIIYLRQIQDIIRASDFNIETIDRLIVNQFTVSEKIKIKIRDWYQDLINKMKDEKIMSEGDLSFVTQLINDLDIIHNELLKNPDEYKHAELYRWAKPHIEEFRLLSGNKNSRETKVCIDALYSLLLLRVKKQNVSEETMQAMQTFSNLLAHLALKYKEKRN